MINPPLNASDVSQVPLVVPQPNGSQASVLPTNELAENCTPSANSLPAKCLPLVDYRSEYVKLAQKAESAASYWRAAVRKIAGQGVIVGLAMHGQLAGESLTDFACIASIDGESKQKLRAVLQETLVSCECHEQPICCSDCSLANVNLLLLAIPLRSQEQHLNAVVSFALRPVNERELLLIGERLKSLLLQAAIHIPGLGPITKATDSQARSLELIGKSSAYRDTREFAFALVGSLATRYGCSKVGLGVVDGGGVSVLSISGTEQFKATSPGVIDLRQAMEEALDAQAIVSGQFLARNAMARSMPIHQRLSTSTRSALVSLPLKSGPMHVAVLTLQRDANSPFSDAEIEGLQSLLVPFGPAIALSMRGDRSFVEHCKQELRARLRRVTDPATRVGRAARNLLVLAILVFFCGWMPYRPATPCTVVPANLSQSIARFDMKLTEALVRSGDRVGRGQVLARFETRQLELERARLIAGMNQAEVDVRKSLAASDPAGAALAKTASRSFQCQIDAIESKLADCTLVAPCDGMVVAAELSTRIGQIFPQGEPILSFAPMDQWELQLHIPERLARFVQSEQVGSFALRATPGHTHTFRIETVSGAAEVVAGKNVIVARAVLEGAPAELRHGMTGTARTHTGWQPICWVALHSAYEALYDLFWL